MAAAEHEEDAAAFDDDDDLEDSDTDLENDEISAAGAQTPPPSLTADLSLQNPSPNPALDPIHDLKRQKIEERKPPPSASALDESRRLFQRLWTDDDEIKILKGFLEFTSSRGTTFASHQYDTGPFYEQIKNELQLDFNKNQLIEKLRRLKKKYRNTANRMANRGKDFNFKSPHEKETYDIAKKIWSVSVKSSRESDEDDLSLNPYANNSNHNTSDAGVGSERKVTSARSRRRGRKKYLEALSSVPAPVAAVGPPEGVVKVDVQTVHVATPTPAQNPGAIEETVKSCLSPIFKELLNSGVSAPLGLLDFGGDLGKLTSDEKWRKQQILELEVYLKRVELIRDHVKSTLEELKASSSSSAGS